MIGSDRGFTWRVLALALFVAGALAIFVVLLNIAGGVNVAERYRFTAVVPTALQLSQNADVTSAGVRIGRVEEISNRGATAVLALAIEPERGPVHRDARVQVRAKTLVGENYIDLDPGTTSAPALPDGGELPIARTIRTTQLDDILSTISPTRRARLGRLLRGLGTGLRDSRDVGRTVGGVSELAISGKRLVAPLAAQRQALRTLVTDLGVVFRAVGERRAMLRQLVMAAKATATDVAAEDAALRAGLRELPPTLQRTRRTTARLAAVGGRAAPVLDDLTVALRALAPLTRELPGSAGATLRALRRLERAAPATNRLLASLRRLGGPGAAMVPALDDGLRELRPALKYLAPYSTDAGSFFAGLGLSVSARDATGNLARIQPVLSSAALTLVGDSELKASEALLGSGLARVANVRGANNLPEPDTLAAPKAFAGSYPRLQRDAAP